LHFAVIGGYNEEFPSNHKQLNVVPFVNTAAPAYSQIFCVEISSHFVLISSHFVVSVDIQMHFPDSDDPFSSHVGDVDINEHVDFISWHFVVDSPETQMHFSPNDVSLDVWH
jgi:hypothetical protein